MPTTRPRREDIPDDCDPADILHELRMLDYRVETFFEEFRQYRAEINGDHLWLRMFRARANEAGKVGLILLPVLATAALAVHLTA